MNLNEYYDSRVRELGSREFLAQVGHTEGGRPISHRQFRSMCGEIVELLELGSDDRLLDLCCGNGMITAELARIAKSVVGIDSSKELIVVAREFNTPQNACYHVQDSLQLDSNALDGWRFEKVLLFGALQHFDEDEFEIIMKQIMGICTADPVILIGFVPDRSCRGRFYNTSIKRAKHLLRRLTGRELIGTWWEKQFIEHVCRALGLRCSFHRVTSRLSASEYRFHVKVTNSRR